MAKAKGGKMLGATMTVSLVVLISKALGFLRDIIMAHMHGTSAAMDAYNAAYGVFYIPVLLMSSCVTSTLVPLYIRSREENGLPSANRFASNALSIFSILSLIITALMMAFARPIIALVHSGFSPETAELSVRLVRVMLPGLMFYVLAILFSSILNANKRYIAAQLTGFPLSFSLITTTLLSGGPDGIEMLAWGVAAAGVLQVLVEYPFARREFKFYPHLNLKDSRFQMLVRMAIPALLSMAANELNHMIDRSLASGLPEGSISSMNYAFKLITFALGVLIVPLTTIMFSRMSEKAARKDHKGMADILSSALETILLVTIPISVLGCILSRDIISLAYARGHFDARSVDMTSSVFLFYLLGLAFFSLRDLFNRAFHALGDTRTPMWVAAGGIAINIALNIILVKIMGANGLALATSISGGLCAAALLALLIRRMGHIRLVRTLVEVCRDLICGAACGAAAMWLHSVIPTAHNMLSLILRLIAICAAGLCVYFSCALLLGARPLSGLRRRLLRRQ